jgi:hypothetical protein
VPIRNLEALNERAKNLGTLNGVRLVLIALNPAANPVEARLTVQFFNANAVGAILAATAGNPVAARQMFPIKGGRRIPAGPLAGQVQTVAVSGNPGDDFIELTVQPVGDYSVYMLNVDRPDFDPLLSSIDFKFRPGCFNVNCAPEWEPAGRPAGDPQIDYLNKDYDSFRHTMIAAMMERVPGWRATSEADLDQTLIDLFSAAADELSDFQDRVVQEGYIGSARRRVSLARHARLMDYHIHQGNQARATIALQLAPTEHGVVAAGELAVRSGPTDATPTSQTFVNRDPQQVDALLNRVGLYTWQDSIPALAQGDTSADLRLHTPGQAAADTVRDLIRDGKISRLLIAELLNPTTGRTAGADPKKRQILTLLPNAETLQDPLTSDFFVRVNWIDADALRGNFCFTIDCPQKVEDVSGFQGNLIEVFHGDIREEIYEELSDSMSPGAFPIDRPAGSGAVLRLPPGPLAYLDTVPSGDTPPQSTIELRVQTTAGISTWQEKADLIHSDGEAEHFVVETDELGASIIRFGDDDNGRALPQGARVFVRYQSGFGPDGNVGHDSITTVLNPPPLLLQATCSNPFDAASGRAPEPPERIIRRAPEMFRFRQLRAVTLDDYRNRAEELPEVSRAAASYGWTGSWRTVRIAIDPKGGVTIDDALRLKLARHLDAVRLIGEDLEIRPPVFVPLEIHVTLCVSPDFWPEDMRFIVEQEFSTGYTPDGRPAFFNPDNWTFNQAIYASQILGALQAIPGVEHVIRLTMKRWNSAAPAAEVESIAVQANEIILVNSDPDRMEEGFIDFDLRGGRQ